LIAGSCKPRPIGETGMKIHHMGLGALTVGLAAGSAVWALTVQRPAEAARPTEPVQADDRDDEADEVVIGLGDLPAAVREALANVTPEGAVTRVARESEHGRTIYDVEYTKDGARWDAEFSEGGALLENELDDESGDDDGPD